MCCVRFYTCHRTTPGDIDKSPVTIAAPPALSSYGGGARRLPSTTSLYDDGRSGARGAQGRRGAGVRGPDPAPLASHAAAGDGVRPRPPGGRGCRPGHLDHLPAHARPIPGALVTAHLALRNSHQRGSLAPPARVAARDFHLAGARGGRISPADRRPRALRRRWSMAHAAAELVAAPGGCAREP